MLLAALGPALNICLEGPNLITKAALLILALVELAPQVYTSVPLSLDALLQLVLRHNKAIELLLSSPHNI